MDPLIRSGELPPAGYTELLASDMRNLLRGLSALSGAMALAMSILLLAAYGPLAPATWRLALIAGGALAFGLLLLGWRVMLRRKPTLELMHDHIVALTVLGATVAWLASGGDLLLPLVAPGLFLGGLMAPTARRGLVFGAIAIPQVALLSTDLAAGFLPAGWGFAKGAAAVSAQGWIRLGLLCLQAVVMLLLGIAIRRILHRLIGNILIARHQLLASLTNRNQEIVAVSTTVAHELKNPLAAIQGLVELMARDEAPGTRDATRFEVILRETTRMNRTIDEFRNFSRPMMRLRAEHVVLPELLREVALLNEGIASSRKVGLQVGATEPLVACCDATRMAQALTNVVQNALEASAPGAQVSLALDAVLVAGERHARIRVTDSGSGLSPEVQARLFVPGVTTKEGGSGIGLVIASAICGQHGGRLELANGPAGGCVATLTLPLQPSADVACEVEE